jgi:hypothetical protein
MDNAQFANRLDNRGRKNREPGTGPFSDRFPLEINNSLVWPIRDALPDRRRVTTHGLSRLTKEAEGQIPSADPPPLNPAANERAVDKKYIKKGIFERLT